MPSTIVLITAVASFIGFAINSLVMIVLLSYGRRQYHYLFALILFVSACWDFGIFLVMIRNSYPNEIIFYHNLLSIPLFLLPAFIYHFTTTYLNQPQRKYAFAFYLYCILGPLGFLTGVYQPFSSVYNYDWGNFGRVNPNILMNLWPLVYYLSILVSCYLLIQARKQESSPVTRRHITYIFVSFIVYSIAPVKVLISYGINVPFFLPLGILLIGFFGALIGMAIIKARLFDITILVRKGIIYSVLAMLIIFIFDFSQHLITIILGEIAGKDSAYIHFVSIGIVIIAFMPLKQRLERTIERAFAKKTIEF